MPGLDVKPLLDELRARVAEELDYRLEAASQDAFADAFAGDPDIFVPRTVAATDHVLVSEWMDGTPLAKIIAEGTQDQRDRAGLLLVRLLFSSPARAGLLHADPHPGNFRLLDDGRLGVLDFGAVDRLPDGLPPLFGRLLWLVHTDGDIAVAEADLREHGFLRPDVSVDMEALRTFLAPLADPSRHESFKFSREWMRGEAARVTDLRGASVARQLNLPPSYILIHRVSTAGIGVLCQLEAQGEFRSEVLRWMPGYGPDDLTSATPVDDEGPGALDRRNRAPSRLRPRSVMIVASFRAMPVSQHGHDGPGGQRDGAGAAATAPAAARLDAPAGAQPSGGHVVLTWPAAPALAGHDLAADEQFSSPHSPRLPALDGAGQARGPDRAVAAQRLGQLNVVG